MQDESTTPERWLPVVGYEGFYEVSDRGRIRRVATYRSTHTGRVLKPAHNTGGYLTVSLSTPEQIRSRTVHVLVAEAFLGPRPVGYEVNHKDGVKDNVSLSNLEYVTRSENQAHSFRIGRKRMNGEHNSGAKLTEEKVHAIRALRGQMSSYKIAALFGVTRSAVNSVLQGYSWKSV